MLLHPRRPPLTAFVAASAIVHPMATLVQVIRRESERIRCRWHCHCTHATSRVAQKPAIVAASAIM